MWCACFAVTVAGPGCAASHETRPDQGADASGVELSVGDAASDSGRDAQDDSDVDPPLDAGRPPTICAGVVCEADEFCCFRTGQCATPGDGSCVPPDTGPLDCASNADCEADEFCRSPGELCVGAGVCTPRDYRTCSRNAPHCGCDGRTYQNACEAEEAGIRVARFPGECGSEGGDDPSDPDHPATCGTDENCTGTSCCHITGLCLPPDCPDCCFDPTDQPGFYPCGSDAYCARFTRGDFCNAVGCEGPGVCAQSGSSCLGTLDPVCGCDGSTYTNASCAQRDAVRVDYVGECVP